MKKLDEYLSKDVFIFNDKVIETKNILRMSSRYYADRKQGRKYVLTIDYAGGTTTINFKHYKNMETIFNGIKEKI